MKKIVAMLGIFSLLFLCVNCTKESETFSEENAKVPSLKEPIIRTFDATTGEPVSNTMDQPENCNGITFDLLTTQSLSDGCCLLSLNINSPNKQSIQVYLDGVFYGGGASLGASYPIRVCDKSVLIEVYSEGVLCYSNLASCRNRCCDQIDYTVESAWIEGCCVYRFTLFRNGPNSCLGIQYGFISPGGVDDSNMEIIDGNPVLTVTLCDTNDSVRFFILDSATGARCQMTKSFTGNSCIP